MVDPPPACARKHVWFVESLTKSSTTSIAGLVAADRWFEDRTRTACIVDQVITMADIPMRKAAAARFRLPDAELLELSGQGPLRPPRHGRAPHLGRLMEKIQRPAAPASERTDLPCVQPTEPAPAHALSESSN